LINTLHLAWRDALGGGRKTLALFHLNKHNHRTNTHHQIDLARRTAPPFLDEVRALLLIGARNDFLGGQTCVIIGLL
jgi:hypothetical protein